MLIALIFFGCKKYPIILLSRPPESDIEVELHSKMAFFKILYRLSIFLSNIPNQIIMNKDFL